MNNENLTLTEYELKEILGKGTFSKVKLGMSKLTKEKVAIKIIDKQFTFNNNNYERIKLEISILKKTSHPNIIKVYDIKEDSNNYYFIMEYCKYGELFQQIVNSKHLDAKLSSFYFYQLINGLSYLHSHKIVHRDLKPENLLISHKKVLKIIDFGLSNFSIKNNYLNTPCGSPSYAPPEMIIGAKYNGMLGDIWNCGVILYVMLCGCLPFDGSNNNELFSKIIKCKVNYPKNMDKSAVDLLKNILVANPDNRINLTQIKKHPFYLKGKKIFSEILPELIDKIEIKDNNNDNSQDSKIFYGKNIKPSKSNKLVYDKNKTEKNLNDYISKKNIKNNNEKTEGNLYKKNLILRTKNINFYKQILSDPIKIQKVRKSIINYATNQNNNSINTSHTSSSCNKMNKNRNIINTSISSKNKRKKSFTQKNVNIFIDKINKKENINNVKTVDKKKIIREKSPDNNYQKNIIQKYNNLKNYINECQSPRCLMKIKLSSNNKKFDEEEKNSKIIKKNRLFEVHSAKKETKNFNINNNIKKIRKYKKIYENEINHFSNKN